MLNHHRELALEVVAEFNSIEHRRTGKWYKLIPVDPNTGRIQRAVAMMHKASLEVLVISRHNLEKCAINQKPQITALHARVYRDEIRGTVRPATQAQIETYVKCWPDLRSLLCPKT